MTVIIKTIYRDQATIEEYDYRDAMEIHIEGEAVFSVSDGEPEDSNMSRDFSDVCSVPDLMEKAYKLGKSGVEVEFTSEESADI